MINKSQEYLEVSDGFIKNAIKRVSTAIQHQYIKAVRAHLVKGKPGDKPYLSPT
jgi:hypothetical protein